MGKLTKEERKALRKAKLAQKAMEAEMERRQREMEHLEREIEMTRKNHAILHKKFRSEILKNKLEEMHEDVEAAWKQFNKAIECKDFEISMKLDELDEANQQHLTNFMGHIEQINRLIILLRSRIADIQQRRYENSLNELTRIRADHLMKIDEKMFDDDQYFKQMKYQLTYDGQRLMKKSNTLHKNKMDSEDSAADELMQGIRYKFEIQLQKIWSDYLDVLNRYQQHINLNKKEYDRLVRTDTKNRQIIDRKLNRIAILIDYVKRLKAQVKDVETIQNRKLYDLRAEKQIFADTFWTLRTTLRDDSKMDERNTGFISQEANSVIEHLKSVYNKGKQILTLTSNCYQMERENEKIIPFPYLRDRKSRKDPTAIDGGVKFMFSNEFIKFDVPELNRFWIHFGQSESETIKMIEERAYLTRENKFLKKKLDFYCQSATYSNPYLPRMPSKRYEYYNRKKNKMEPGPVNAINCTEILYKII